MTSQKVYLSIFDISHLLCIHFENYEKELGMRIYGYHRTSTKEQHLDRGLTEIKKYCEMNDLELESIFVDQQTGKNFNRPRYTVLVEDVLRPGDCLLITELDRLGRNKRETMKEIQRFKEIGIRLMVLELPTTLMDFSKMDNALAKLMLETINNMMLELYASMAEAEMEKKEKRQKEGIAAKKVRGEWEDYGRPRAISQEKFNQAFERVASGEIGPTALRRELGLSSATFYRYRKNYINNHPNFSQQTNS